MPRVELDGIVFDNVEMQICRPMRELGLEGDTERFAPGPDLYVILRWPGSEPRYRKGAKIQTGQYSVSITGGVEMTKAAIDAECRAAGLVWPSQPVFEFVGNDGEGHPKWMKFPCQGKVGQICLIALRPSQKNAMGASWQWDGNREEPTITPSIDCSRVCGWHGFIQAGHFVK